MLIFLDTEFTDLLNPELLSLGLVTLDGREHYAELDTTTEAGKARVKASSAFVQSGIFDMWGLVPGATGTEWEMGRRTGEWLLALAAETGNRIEVAFDYSMDYELMEYAIRDAGLWDQVREVVFPVNVNPITGTITGELGAEACFRELGKRGLKRHHALADALALRAAYMAVKVAALAHVRAKSTPIGMAGMDGLQKGNAMPMSCTNTDNSLHKLADYPVLARLANGRTTASHLDGRACRFIYQAALHEINISSFSNSERQLFDALGLTPGQKNPC